METSLHCSHQAEFECPTCRSNMCLNFKEDTYLSVLQLFIDLEALEMMCYLNKVLMHHIPLNPQQLEAFGTYLPND